MFFSKTYWVTWLVCRRQKPGLTCQQQLNFQNTAIYISALFQQGARRNRTGRSSGPPLNRAKKILQCASQRPVSGFGSSSPKVLKSSPSTTSTCARAPRPCPPLCTLIGSLSTAQPQGFSLPWTLVIAPCPHHHARGILATHLLGLLWWSTLWLHLALPPCDEGTKWRPQERHLLQAASSSICCQASPRYTVANPTNSSWGTAWMTRRHQSKCCTPMYF